MEKQEIFDNCVKAGASVQEAKLATEVFEVLRPGLRVKKNGRVDLVGGDKTPLGLYRTIISVIRENGGVL